MAKKEEKTKQLGEYYYRPEFENAREYVTRRYNFLEDRFINTFRYVDPHPNNADCFSLEYSNLLVEACRMFSSIMDNLYKGIEYDKTDNPLLESDKVKKIENSKPDIGDFREILLEKTNKINCQSVRFTFFKDKCIWPFEALEDENGTPIWWKAYNDIKHKDIFHYYHGNFRNTISAIAGVYIISNLVNINMHEHSKIFVYWPGSDSKSETDNKMILFQDK